MITTRTARIRLTWVPSGEFLMGSAANDKDADDDERPQHHVEITKPFYLGITEVTRGQFRAFVEDTDYRTEAEQDGTGSWGWNDDYKQLKNNSNYTWRNAGFHQTDDHPVVNVSWNDAQAFIVWLSGKEGKSYRLPTEAEWEYACRAGTTTAYSSGDDTETLAAIGNVLGAAVRDKNPRWTILAARNGYAYTAPVGRFPPNAFGLHDMHGNVCEWCQDGYAAAYYKRSPPKDPPGPLRASARVLRGGNWFDDPQRCRSAARFRYATSVRTNVLGFRVARGQSGR